MSKGKIAGREPMVLDLEAKTYYWCACGRSQNQPWCDGSHQGTEFSPVELVLSEPRKAALCICKQTDSPPLCDGSHTRLADD
jgi:CDGSH-type Zn-finger protein